MAITTMQKEFLPVQELFFQLLQIAVQKRPALGRLPSAEEWRQLYGLCKAHALVGVGYVAVKSLPKEQQPNAELMLKWYGIAEKIRKQGQKSFQNCVLLSQDMESNGKPHCILKGAGLALLYPDPLSRVAGDIDVWVPGDRVSTVEYMQAQTDVEHVVYHHCSAVLATDDKVEIHFVPSWMFAFRLNRRLQRFFAKALDADFREKVIVPDGDGYFYRASLSFNRVYLLIHIFRHLIEEGVGLRQLMDYYFVLSQGCTAQEKQEAMKVLRSLKLERFAGGVMYVLQEVFQLDAACFLCPVDEVFGKYLLSEAMVAGNFGRANEKVRNNMSKSTLGSFCAHVGLIFRFLRYFPEEVLSAPWFKIWHYFWRKRHGWV